MLETNMPGRTNALLQMFPDFSACPSLSTASYPVQEESVIDPTLDEVYPFLFNWAQDMTTQFGAQLLHLGADNVDISCWNTSKNVIAFQQAHAAQCKDTNTNTNKHTVTPQ